MSDKLLELSAPDFVLPLTIEEEGTEFRVFFRMKTYSALSIKQLMNTIGAKFRKVAGTRVTIVPSNRETCYPFFDSHFIEMIGVDGSIEEQKAFLDENPHIKAQVVADVLIGGVELEKPEEITTLKLALSGVKKKAIKTSIRLAPNPPEETVFTLIHHFQPIAVSHYAKYDRAVENEFNTRRDEFSATTDYDTVDRLYNELIESVEGATTHGAECGTGNKGWENTIPFVMKAAAIDEAMRRARAKK
jgi:hypothetical protein